MERTKTNQNKENSILIEGALKQKDITILNIYLSNSGEPNFTKSIILMLKTQISFIILIPNSFRSSERKNKQRSTKIKWNYTLNKPKRHLQNIPPKHQIIYILLSSPWIRCPTYTTFWDTKQILANSENMKIFCVCYKEKNA